MNGTQLADDLADITAALLADPFGSRASLGWYVSNIDRTGPNNRTLRMTVRADDGSVWLADVEIASVTGVEPAVPDGA